MTGDYCADKFGTEAALQFYGNYAWWVTFTMIAVLLLRLRFHHSLLVAGVPGLSEVVLPSDRSTESGAGGGEAAGAKKEKPRSRRRPQPSKPTLVHAGSSMSPSISPGSPGHSSDALAEGEASGTSPAEQQAPKSAGSRSGLAERRSLVSTQI